MQGFGSRSHGHHWNPVAHFAQCSSVAQGGLPGEMAEHESHAEVQVPGAGVGPGGGEGQGGCASEGGGDGAGGGDGGGLGCGGGEGGGEGEGDMATPL